MNALNTTATDLQLKEKTYVCTAQQFELGSVYITQGIRTMLKNSIGVDLSIYLLRHKNGDWGNVDIEDKIANDESTRIGERVLSSYHVSGEKIWVITERDRSCTTILLPSEY